MKNVLLTRRYGAILETFKKQDPSLMGRMRLHCGFSP
ncbi:hypothetical protein CCACVL1_11543 [Corchorus capsularis]|uniref:Uncharacterized protein n=1 Tax=Corchorus capsularis TaxID=210143 RepID=A0A1R3IKR4_COCAP|nr:hypothetical protein CCACVL1_11543 [Corchorus capsularis]